MILIKKVKTWVCLSLKAVVTGPLTSWSSSLVQPTRLTDSQTILMFIHCLVIQWWWYFDDSLMIGLLISSSKTCPFHYWDVAVLRAPPYQEDACDQQQIDDKRNERETYKYQLSKDDNNDVDDYDEKEEWENENNKIVTCKQILLMIIQILLMIMQILLMITIIRKKGTMTTMVRLPANNAYYNNS